MRTAQSFCEIALSDSKCANQSSKVVVVKKDELEKYLTSGESFTTEFKQEPFNDHELVEAVVCLANGSGGVLFVGVSDSGRVLGAKPRHGDSTDPTRVRAVIANRTDPSVLAEVEVLTHPMGEIIAVHVPAARSVVGTIDGKYVRRAIDVRGRPQCLPMRPNEVLARAGSIGAQDYSAVAIPGVGPEDLDTVELERFRRLAGSGGDKVLAELADDDLLKAIGVLSYNGEYTVAAILLFGTPAALAAHVSTHEVGFQVLEDLAVRVNRIERWPLIRAMEEIAALIAPYNPEDEVDVGLFRLGLPRFTEVAIRELFANALVHRDYTSRGIALVQLEDSELRVSSPGGFPEGITPSNLLVAPPRPRNPLLADVFKRAGLVERTGRGVNRVYASQLAAGHAPPDYGRSTDTWVDARLRSGPADRMLAAYVEETRRQGRPFSVNDLLVLHEVRSERRISSARAGDLLQLRQEEARIVLNQLVERGMLESRSERKGRTYHLAAAVYRRLGEPGGYVRTRGFDSLQQEQMVLTFVDSHGSITRAQVAELCQLGSDQASRLLRTMRDKGTLELTGEKRAARYTKARTP